LVHYFAEEDGTAITKLRHEVSELVPGIGHGDGFGRIRNPVPAQKLNPFRTGEAIGVKAEL